MDGAEPGRETDERRLESVGERLAASCGVSSGRGEEIASRAGERKSSGRSVGVSGPKETRDLLSHGFGPVSMMPPRYQRSCTSPMAQSDADAAPEEMSVGDLESARLYGASCERRPKAQVD
jgi:hypothetical protein